MSRPAFNSWSPLVVMALAWAVGCEALRALLPMLVFGIRDRFRWSALGAEGSLRLGAIAFSFFALAFLAGPLRRVLGTQRLMILTVCALAVARLGLQLWSGDPLGHLLFLALVVLALMLMLPSAASSFGGTTMVFGVLSGSALDTALNGLLSTYDLNWRDDSWSLLFVLFLIGLLLLSLRRATSEERGEFPTGGLLRWTVFGPFIFLHLLILGNLPRLTVLSGWSQEVAYLWLLSGQVAAFLLVLESSRRRQLPAAPWGAVLVALLAFPWPKVGFPFLLVGCQVFAALLLARALLESGREPSHRDRSGQGHGLGMMLLASLFFLYYGSYDLALPVPNAVLPPLAAGCMALAALAGGHTGKPVGHTLRLQPIMAAMFCLLLLPLGRLVVSKPLPVLEDSSFPLRVMTYNLHCGYSAGGFLTLEEQAQAIEEQGADVVALQEVSRGWVINGSVDMLEWLSRRLGMEYSYAPTADPLWGNAVLSRRRIGSEARLAFEHGGVQIRRGLLEVEIPVEEGEPLRLIATHFHHRTADSAIRVEESRMVLDFWQGRPRTVLLGDFNAPPNTIEMDLFRAQGFRDVLAIGGIEPGFTFRADHLTRRLDYIWITPDLTAQEMVISPSMASDHLPVAATLAPAEEK